MANSIAEVPKIKGWSEAALWFISRYIHSEAGKNYCLRYNRLSDGRSITNPHHERHAEYAIKFIQNPQEAGTVLVVGMTPEASWAAGVIRRDTNSRYYYTSI